MQPTKLDDLPRNARCSHPSREGSLGLRTLHVAHELLVVLRRLLKVRRLLRDKFVDLRRQVDGRKAAVRSCQAVMARTLPAPPARDSHLNGRVLQLALQRGRDLLDGGHPQAAVCCE